MAAQFLKSSTKLLEEVIFTVLDYCELFKVRKVMIKKYCFTSGCHKMCHQSCYLEMITLDCLFSSLYCCTLAFVVQIKS